MFEQGRFLSSFLFQVFRELSLSMSLILIQCKLKYWQTKLRSFSLFAKADLCMQGKVISIFFSIYVMSSTRLPLMPSITWMSFEVLCQGSPLFIAK